MKESKELSLKHKMHAIYGATHRVARQIKGSIRSEGINPEGDIVVQTKKEMEGFSFVSAKQIGDTSDRLVECFFCERPVRAKYSHYVFEESDGDSQLYFCKRCTRMAGIKEFTEDEGRIIA